MVDAEIAKYTSTFKAARQPAQDRTMAAPMLPRVNTLASFTAGSGSAGSTAATGVGTDTVTNASRPGKKDKPSLIAILRLPGLLLSTLDDRPRRDRKPAKRYADEEFTALAPKKARTSTPAATAAKNTPASKTKKTVSRAPPMGMFYNPNSRASSATISDGREGSVASTIAVADAQIATTFKIKASKESSLTIPTTDAHYAPSLRTHVWTEMPRTNTATTSPGQPLPSAPAPTRISPPLSDVEAARALLQLQRGGVPYKLTEADKLLVAEMEMRKTEGFVGTLSDKLTGGQTREKNEVFEARKTFLLVGKEKMRAAYRAVLEANAWVGRKGEGEGEGEGQMEEGARGKGIAMDTSS